jgi:hypothetical protein
MTAAEHVEAAETAVRGADKLVIIQGYGPVAGLAALAQAHMQLAYAKGWSVAR